MVQIWQMDPYIYGDPRLPHHVFPPKIVTPDELSRRTGTLYWKVDMQDRLALSKRLRIMRQERKLNKEDLFTLDANATPNFSDKIEELFKESAHPEDQAILIMDGSAYYDVEDKKGIWMRILCEYGDLIVIPGNTSFRLTTTPQVK
ncbi:ARD/ARD' family protein [Cooperia oncophora]